MTIIIDLNTDQLRTEPIAIDLSPADIYLDRLRFDSAPMDTVMVISARQRRHLANNPPQLNQIVSPSATAVGKAGDEDITWEDAEWQ